MLSCKRSFHFGNVIKVVQLPLSVCRVRAYNLNAVESLPNFDCSTILEIWKRYQAIRALAALAHESRLRVFRLLAKFGDERAFPQERLRISSFCQRPLFRFI